MTSKETNSVTISLATVEAVVQMYRKAWREEQKRADELVENAVRNRTGLPDNYWVAAHKAAGKYQLARAFADSIKVAMEEQ